MNKEEAFNILKYQPQINPMSVKHMEAIRKKLVGEDVKIKTTEDAVKHLESIKDVSSADIVALIMLVLKILKDSGVLNKNKHKKEKE